MIDGLGKTAVPRLPAIGADNRLRGGPAAPAAVDRAAPAAAVDRPAPGAAAGLTGRALVRDMAAAPPVDAARVEALRNAILAGTYKVDPEAIAARMIALEQGSGGR